jgi:hypothetical protein
MLKATSTAVSRHYRARILAGRGTPGRLRAAQPFSRRVHKEPRSGVRNSLPPDAGCIRFNALARLASGSRFCRKWDSPLHQNLSRTELRVAERVAEFYDTHLNNRETMKYLSD